MKQQTKQVIADSYYIIYLPHKVITATKSYGVNEMTKAEMKEIYRLGIRKQQRKGSKYSDSKKCKSHNCVGVSI